MAAPENDADYNTCPKCGQPVPAPLTAHVEQLGGCPENDAPLCGCGTLTDLGGPGPQHDGWCPLYRATLTEQPTVVYELLNGGRSSWSRVGVFTSIETAKEVAALVLDTYHEFDGDEDTEQTNYEAEWVMQRETLGGRGRHEVGDPKPFRVYGSEGSAFKISTIVLDTARTATGVIYPPGATDE